MTKDFERPSRKLIEELSKVTVATASTVMRSLIQGPVDGTIMPNIRPLFGADYSLCGPAVTIKFEEEPLHAHLLSMGGYILPEELRKEVQRPIHDAKDALKPGDIIVNAMLGQTRYGTYGDVYCHAFKGKGAIGLITDGVMRDTKFMRKLFPVYTRMGDAVAWDRHGVRSGVSMTAVDYNVPVTCDSALVRPGDIILADESVMVIPIEFAEKIAEIGAPLEEREVLQRKLALTGIPTGPPHTEGREEYFESIIKSLTKEQAEQYDLLEEWGSLKKGVSIYKILKYDL
jgi:4-hydroxy-4-methyl-2-oxoglutarate aldolase